MAERRTRIPVLETFGPTVQGEGMVIGVKTCFVRTAGCDYSCSWCDSAFTWDGSAKDDIRWLEPEDVLEELKALSGGEWPGHVTLSGGNPALLPQLGGLIALLRSGGTIIALETQGSRWQDWFLDVDELTLSPKPPSSGMATDWARLDEIVERLAAAGRSPSLKVVVMEEPASEAGSAAGTSAASETGGARLAVEANGASRQGSDLAYAKEVHRRFPAVSMFLQAGNDRLDEPDPAALREHLAARYERLVDAVMADPDWRHVRVLPQLHAWLWGNKRGV
ncbi:Queuosine Biosynthesis QueE Radical SAM [Paenibacillus pasadenensis]|uniref:7-carboxy-7-deazaguanine synthase n=1 Tax=Paenibacillus pasadenensis TaxID=217090 RepID=A0A2N5N128_9BACL|nr:7-carboxy-7-deazaguanine synthase QueE [Paenibacillus pasadenensis]PLT44032.1 Queuosine Biosynthesis QueE Radical SAM [Paenibacillus pasadenensis]